MGSYAHMFLFVMITYILQSVGVVGFDILIIESILYHEHIELWAQQGFGY